MEPSNLLEFLGFLVFLGGCILVIILGVFCIVCVCEYFADKKQTKQHKIQNTMTAVATIILAVFVYRFWVTDFSNLVNVNMYGANFDMRDTPPGSCAIKIDEQKVHVKGNAGYLYQN